MSWTMAENEQNISLEIGIKTRDPETALIITQNNWGEIVDVEITDFVTGYFMAFHGPNSLDPDREPYTGPSWWDSSEEHRERPEP